MLEKRNVWVKPVVELGMGGSGALTRILDILTSRWVDDT